ncbi:TonB-dependent receptor, partial [Klebsiella pneumoniae]|nr:TonB-dependent receptor [Klebsiella pneumoniae]
AAVEAEFMLRLAPPHPDAPLPDSAAAAMAWVDELRIGINGSRAERAPSAEELFSDGPHIATQAFEIGDVDLRTERAWGLEAYARGRIGAGTFNLTAFRQWFKNYIYLDETGEEEDDLPVFQYLQQDADFWGVEAELNYPIIDTGSFRLLTDLRASYVEAELDNGTNVPRIPPLSLLGRDPAFGPVDPWLPAPHCLQRHNRKTRQIDLPLDQRPHPLKPPVGIEQALDRVEIG